MNEIELKEVFSKNLKYLLDLKNVTKKELSDYLGVSESTVGKWALKKSLPRMGLIEKIANFFEVQKSDLLENKALANSTKKIQEQQQIKTIAAHFDGEMTKDEMNDIIKYIEFVKSKRN